MLLPFLLTVNRDVLPLSLPGLH